MKRIIVAACMLAVIIAIAVAGQIYMSCTIHNMQDRVADIRRLAECSKVEQAADIAKGLQDDFKNAQGWLALFVRQDTLAATYVSLHGMYAYSTPDTIEDLKCEADKAGAQLHALEKLLVL